MDEAKILKLAGKNAAHIIGVDEAEGEFSVWLEEGYQQRGYCNSIIVISEDDDAETVKYQLSLIEPA